MHSLAEPRGESSRCTLLWALLALGCAAGGEASAARAPLALLDDTCFRRGLIVWSPAPGKKVRQGALRPVEGAGEPVWGLAQWHSRFSLAGARPERLPAGAVRFADRAKALVFGPRGSPEADLTLALDARVEYDHRAPERGAAWPHLLVERTLLHHPAVPAMQALRFRIAYRLLRSTTPKLDGLEPRRHAAQFLLYLTVQNRNRQSPGFGDFLWFGLKLYDSRHRLPPAYAARDFSTPQKKGTGKFIFQPALSRLTRQSAHDGHWVRLDADLLPLVREALELAWTRGYLQASRSPADYRLGAMNMGWEVTGPLDVAVQVRGLALEAAPLTPPALPPRINHTR